MKYVVVAPAGPNLDALYVGIKEVPTEKIYLIAEEKKIDYAEKAKKELEKFKIPVEIFQIEGDPWEEIFRSVAEIKKKEFGKQIIINVGTGDKDQSCAATSAAFVNGLKAFSIKRNELMMLPVLKFSYYKMLVDKKLQILSILFKDRNCCASLDELSKKTNMSLPLLAYHINGNMKSEGLKQMDLVETEEKGGRIQVKLTTLGKLIVKGYVE